MKCAYHPEKDAVAECNQCQKPLCEECGDRRSNDTVYCSRCAALAAAKDAVNGEDERREKHEERKSAAKEEKKPHVAMIVIASLAVIILFANLYMYSGSNVPDFPEFDPHENPVLTATLINDGIEGYAEDHGGKFPEKLEDLIGKYFFSEKITLSVLEKFSYVRRSPTSYELRFKDSNDDDFSDIVFGKEDG